MPRCSATTAKGEPCRANAVEGSELCVAHLGRNGRPSELTPEVTERVCQVLRAGNYLEVAAVAAGISRSTCYDWLKRGDPEGTAPADAPYRDFRESVEKARAEGEARNVTLIAQAAPKNWQAAAWLLERQFPERWGRSGVRRREGDDEGDGQGAGEPADPPLLSTFDELAARRDRRSPT
jgi:transposase